MLEIAQLLTRAISTCESLNVPYMVVGSVASMAYGEYRSTNDIDIVIQLKANDVSAFCNAFPEPDFYVSDSAVREAIRFQRMFNVIETRTGYKIDFAISQDSPWGKSQLERRRSTEILPGVIGYTASPEDVIIAKMLYYKEGESEKHLRDIAAMCRITGDTFDNDYLHTWIERLRLNPIWDAIQKRLAYKDLPRSSK
jgi:hypothetical protein